MEVVHALPSKCKRRELRAYMIGIARRKIADRRRSARDAVVVLETDSVGRFDNAADEAALVEHVLGMLTEDQREVLTLRFVIGLSSQETGAVLDRTPEAIDSLVQRGRAAFCREWNALSSEAVKL